MRYVMVAPAASLAQLVFEVQRVGNIHPTTFFAVAAHGLGLVRELTACDLSTAPRHRGMGVATSREGEIPTPRSLNDVPRR